MNSTTMWIILAVIAVVALYLYQRSRPARRGAYDDPNFRSSGSIGGGTRANDSPQYDSGGSIGGRSTDRRKDETMGSQNSQSQQDEPAKPTHNDKDFKSGGSFGT